MTRSPLERPVQIAYAVVDVEAAALRFAQTTGAGPFFLVEHIAVESARVFGAYCAFDHSSAYGQWGSMMVELVAEHTPPIVEAGSGVHHIAFMVDDLAESAAWCESRGWPEALHARTASGLEFAFRDARLEFGHLVELYEPSDRLVGFYDMVAAAAAAWDGAEPVRWVQ